MTLVSSVHESGLVLVEETRDEAQLRRALKQIDRRLRLLAPGQVFPGTATGYWRVVCAWSDDEPPVPVVTWMDALSNPLPLGSRLLDEVQKHRSDAPNRGPDADARNADLGARVRKDREAAREALHDEYEPYLERERTGVSLGAHNKIPYWMRQHRGGER